MFKMRIYLIICFLYNIISCISIVDTANGWQRHGDYFYYFSNEEMNTNDALGACFEFGGRTSLLSIADREEQIYISSNISDEYIIGLYRVEYLSSSSKEGWIWADYTPYDHRTFHNWASNSLGDNGFAKLQVNGKWIDQDGLETLKYICKKKDTCAQSENTCVHGTCSSVPESEQYTCTCLEDYTGENCNTVINDCHPNPCVHGLCLDGVNSYTCDCTGTGYSGPNCESEMSRASYCSQGICTNSDGSYTCDCLADFYGDSCEIYNGTNIENTSETSGEVKENPSDSDSALRNAFYGCLASALIINTMLITVIIVDRIRSRKPNINIAKSSLEYSTASSGQQERFPRNIDTPPNSSSTDMRDTSDKNTKDPGSVEQIAIQIAKTKDTKHTSNSELIKAS